MEQGLNEGLFLKHGTRIKKDDLFLKHGIRINRRHLLQTWKENKKIRPLFLKTRNKNKKEDLLFLNMEHFNYVSLRVGPVSL